MLARLVHAQTLLAVGQGVPEDLADAAAAIFRHRLLLLADACRLDTCVGGKQICLIGVALDLHHHGTDPLRPAGQLYGGVKDLLGLTGELLNLLFSLAELSISIHAVVTGLAHLLIGILDVAGELQSSAGHLDHGGGHLLSLSILFFDVVIGLVGSLLLVGCQGLQRMGGIIDSSQHGSAAGLLHLEVEIGDGAGFVPPSR